MRIRFLAAALLLPLLPLAPSFTTPVGAAGPYAVDVAYDAPDANPGDGSCDDGTGHCTLRAAVQEANRDEGDDTITLPADQTLALTLAGTDPGFPDYPDVVGDLDAFTFSGSLTITGNGATIDASALDDRVFDALDPNASGGELVLTDLTITGGTASPVATMSGAIVAAGGGILAQGAGLNLDSVTVGDNTADTGGGIAVFGGGLTITSSTISGNEADTGGGIAIEAGGLDMIATTVTTNHATTRGGGISNEVMEPGFGPDLTIQSSLITANTSEGIGGGISSAGYGFAVGGFLSVHTSTIAHNVASGTGGGLSGSSGLYGAGGVSVSDSTINENQAQHGGGLSLAGWGEVIDTSVHTNTATGSGGGAMLHPIDSFVHSGTSLAGSIFEGNDAATGGGLAVSGGGSILGGGPVTYAGGTVTSNTATDGGGVAITGGSGTYPVTLAELAIVGNQASSRGGGAYVESGTPAVVQDTLVSGNEAPQGGGLHVHASELRVTDSKVSANHATISGGGIHTSGTSHLTVDHSAFSSNSAEQLGGGIQNVDANATVTNSTFSGNSAAVRGGAISNAATLAVRYTTVSDNQAAFGGTGIYTGADNPAATTTIGASILVDTSPGYNCAGPGSTTSVGANLSHDTSCTGDPTDLASVDPLLGPLADNGGPTFSHALLPASPARDRVPVGMLECGASISDDQRGVARPQLANCDAGAVEAEPLDALTLVVDTTADALDVAPGDGLCTTAAAACSLRAAIQEANTWSTDDTITFAPGLAGATLTLSRSDTAGDEQANLTGDLDVTDTLTLEGTGTTIDASGLGRVLDHHAGTLTVRDMSVTGGFVKPDDWGSSGDGAGLRAVAPLHLEGVTVRDNVSGYGDGAGIWSTDELTLVASTVRDNAAEWGRGGGIHVREGTLTVDDSTLRGNTSRYSGEVIAAVTTPTTITNSTVSGNGTPGRSSDMLSLGANATLTHVTVADNVGGPGIGAVSPIVTGSILTAGGDRACAGPVVSGGGNLADDDSCGLDHATDLEGAEMLLAPLGDHGGPTATMVPAANSPAVDRLPIGTGGCGTAVASDQRGEPRPTGPACDTGAVEGPGDLVLPLTLIVDAATDQTDAVPGDGVCASSEGECTLRSAIQEANAHPGPDTIEIEVGAVPTIALTGDAPTITLTRAGSDEDHAGTGDLDVRGSLTIEGHGATVDADGIDRVLDLHDGHVTLVDLTLTGGNAGKNNKGGAIRHAATSLTTIEVTIAGNQATYGAGLALESDTHLDQSVVTANTGIGYANTAFSYGGGVSLSTTWSPDLLVTDSSVHDNEAYFGAGIYISGGTASIEGTTLSTNSGTVGSGVHSAGDLTITDSVIEENEAATRGGGLQVGAGQTTIARTRVMGNLAPNGAGISTTGPLTLTETLVAENVATTLGGGLEITGTSDDVAVVARQSAVVANTAPTGAAMWIRQSSPVTMGDTTVSANTATGPTGATIAVAAPSGDSARVELHGSTIAANTASSAITSSDGATASLVASIVDHDGTACVGSGFSSGGGNVVSDATCATDEANDLPDTEALLGPLGDNGGPTPTHEPTGGSPAVDAVAPGAAGCGVVWLADQRGLARPAGDGCDAGAVELIEIVPLALEVTTADDGVDALTGDGVCDRGDGTCSLRAAVMEANAWPTADTITWATADAAQAELTLAGPDEDAGTTGDLDVTGDLTIAAVVDDVPVDGATVDAGGLDRVFDVHGARLTLDGLTITGGDAGAGAGGGLLARPSSTVDLADVTAHTNTAAVGGGLAVAGTATLHDVSLADNTATDDEVGAVSAGAALAIGTTLTATGADLGHTHLTLTHPDLDGPGLVTPTTSLDLKTSTGDLTATAAVELLSDLPSATTITLLGTDTLVPTQLTLPADATIAGTLVLDSTTDVPVLVHASDAVHVSGELEVRAGGGGTRTLTGATTLDIDGSLVVHPSTELLTDASIATGGGLAIDGALTAPDITLDGGLLTGTGTVDAAVAVDGLGTLSPGHGSGPSTGTLTIGGDLTLGPDAFVALEITPADHDGIHVLGTAQLDGVLGVAASAVPDHVPLLTTAIELGITGTFAEIIGVPDTWITTNPAAVEVHAVQTFSDVPLDQTFFLDIAWGAGSDVTTGFTDGSFGPTLPVSRQAAMAWLWRLEGEPEPPDDAPTFSDVPADHQFADPIAWAAAEGITTGYPDGTFGPTLVLTRQTAMAFLHRSTWVHD